MSSPEEITPYQLTPEGMQILEGAQSLRRRLVAAARAEKEGTVALDPARAALTQMVGAMRQSGFDILDVDRVLDEFEDISDRGSRAFELHFFVGLPPERIAAVMRVPERIAERDVAVVKAWLLERLKLPSGAARP